MTQSATCFEPLGGHHHQAEIQNFLGCVNIIYGREISLLWIVLKVQFLYNEFQYYNF
jgi:hypothetical protein